MAATSTMYKMRKETNKKMWNLAVEITRIIYYNIKVKKKYMQSLQEA